MGQILGLVLVIVLAIAGPQFIRNPLMRKLGRLVGGLVAVIAALSTSFVFIDEDETGHLMKIYLGGNLPNGSIIAVTGEKGPQAEVLPPGFHVRPFLNILYDVTKQKVVEIPDGRYGFLVARDGRPLRPDQTFADPFPADDSERMIGDAAFFLTNSGQKGPQTTVLPPGKYRLNLFLWNVEIQDATEIPEGFVGVIKSNVHSGVEFGNLKTARPTDCAPSRARSDANRELAVPLVPVGCVGVWDQSLSPGKYYVNSRAYRVTQVDTRVQTWEYRGGYRKRWIDLKVSQKGDITQTERSSNIPVPRTSVSPAVAIVVEGWGVQQELRALVQVTPQNAPFVVASVDGLEQVESRVLTPAIRSVMRNVVGGTIRVPAPVLDADGRAVVDDAGEPVVEIIHRPTRVLDLIEIRDVLEQNVEDIIRPEGFKAGVDIKEVRFGDPVIPPELLVARQREQLAQQLRRSFAEERLAQAQRIDAEQARATADQQDKLVEAQIEVKRSEQFAVARRNEGLGERDKLNLIAEGQRAQSQVLGEDRVVELRKFEFVIGRAFDFFASHPEVLTTALGNAQKFVPERVFTLGGDGGGESLSGAAGILGDFLSPSRPAPAPAGKGSTAARSR